MPLANMMDLSAQYFTGMTIKNSTKEVMLLNNCNPPDSFRREIIFSDFTDMPMGFVEGLIAFMVPNGGLIFYRGPNPIHLEGPVQGTPSGALKKTDRLRNDSRTSFGFDIDPTIALLKPRPSGGRGLGRPAPDYYGTGSDLDLDRCNSAGGRQRSGGLGAGTQLDKGHKEAQGRTGKRGKRAEGEAWSRTAKKAKRTKAFLLELVAKMVRPLNGNSRGLQPVPAWRGGGGVLILSSSRKYGSFFQTITLE